MAQKINPTSVRLGKQILWNFTFQHYGKSLFSYSFHNSMYLYLLFLTKVGSIWVPRTKLSLDFFSSNIFLVFTIPVFQKNRFKLQIFQETLRKIKLWWPEAPKQLFFLTFQPVKSALFVTLYFKLLLERELLVRKVLLLILNLLKQQVGQSKIIYSKSGVRKITLKGFKLVLSGRFENSKNQMAKKLEYTVGSLSLLSLDSYVEYATVNFSSPLGLCNLKIWLFYY